MTASPVRDPAQPPVIDVVAAVRRDSAGRYWLCRRNGDGAHGGLAGMWEYPGGKVEPGEQLREALVRELQEEFGIQRPLIGAVLDSIEYQGYRVTFFEVEMQDPADLYKHSEVRWMTPDEARRVEHLPSGTIFNARHLVRGVRDPSPPEPEFGGKGSSLYVLLEALRNPVLSDATMGRVVHAAWLCGMESQGRSVAVERQKWETLSAEDRELDTNIGAQIREFIQRATHDVAFHTAPDEQWSKALRVRGSGVVPSKVTKNG